MRPIDENLADCVMAWCDELAGCSEDDDRITRRFLSAPMLEVHDRMRSWMEHTQLQPRVDNAGNIVGRKVSAGAKKTLILGSHLDSVPGAGRFDGVLGVMIGLAVAQQLCDVQLPFHLDVIGFSEEEGVRYSMPYLGSCAAAGVFDSQWLERTDADGVSMRDAISDFLLDPQRIDEAAYSADEVLGYIEPHLEQGPVLERADLPLGVVSGIAGQSRLRLAFVGDAGHAGTTPMTGRSDALLMAAEFVTGVNSVGCRTEGLRATVGKLSASPNAPNVIAGRVEVALDVRHIDDPIREQAVDELLAAGQRIAEQHGGCFEQLERNDHPAVQVDRQLSQLLAESVDAAGSRPLQLFSGAGHDAVVMAKRFPMAMLFLRHPGGVSHHPDERVERDDVAAAIRVLTDFVLRLAQKPEHVQVSK